VGASKVHKRVELKRRLQITKNTIKSRKLATDKLGTGQVVGNSGRHGGESVHRRPT
jgi:hypothetical protein